MKRILSIFLTVTAMEVFAQNSVYLDSISVKDFSAIAFEPIVRGSYRNELAVLGKTPTNWIRKEDVKVLMALVRSDAKCRCVVHGLSSYRTPVTEYSTVGGIAMDLIDAFRGQTQYPAKMWTCTKTDKQRASAIEKWWAAYSK
jgi:hypothetical protein